MDLAKTLAHFLREAVSAGAIAEEAVAQILLNAGECESLKRQVGAGEERRAVAAHLKLQYQRGLLDGAAVGRLAQVLKSQGAGDQTMRHVASPRPSEPLQPRPSPRQTANNNSNNNSNNNNNNSNNGGALPDFSSLPVPDRKVFVQATSDFRGDQSKGQLSFLRGDRILVLRAKPGSPWAVGERQGSDVRGLYPVDYVEEVQHSPRPMVTAAQSKPAPAAAVQPAQVHLQPKPARVAPASEPAAKSDGKKSNPVSPREEDFPMPQFQEDAVDVNVLSGAAQMAGDGKRYEFEQNSEKCIMELDRRKKKIETKISRWMLIKTAHMGDKNLVIQCLGAGVPVDYRDSLTGDSAMMAAANAGKFPIVKLLIEKYGAAVFAVNNANQSALHYAVAAGNEEMAVYFVVHGVSTLHKDAGGNAPMFMATKKMEQALRKAEKKTKKKLDPVLPPGKVEVKTPRAPERDDTPKISSMQMAAKFLVRPAEDSDAKTALKGVSWNTLRGTSDAVDVIFVFIAGTGKLALPMPVKRTSTADDVVNLCCQKLLLTEFQRSLGLVSFSPRGELTEIPGFKPVLVVKSSYPTNRFVLYPNRGAPKTVANRLEQLADAAEAMEAEKT